jgi:hypothetical protein
VAASSGDMAYGRFIGTNAMSTLDNGVLPAQFRVDLVPSALGSFAAQTTDDVYEQLSSGRRTTAWSRSSARSLS